MVLILPSLLSESTCANSRTYVVAGGVLPLPSLLENTLDYVRGVPELTSDYILEE